MDITPEKNNTTGIQDNKGQAADKQETKSCQADETTNSTSQFFPLDELVYAPLKSVALSNMGDRKSVV